MREEYIKLLIIIPILLTTYISREYQYSKGKKVESGNECGDLKVSKDSKT